MIKSKNRQFRDQVIEIKEIAKQFIVLVQTRDNSREVKISDAVRVQSRKEMERDIFIGAVNAAMASLDGMQEHIIKNEFFECSDHSTWWTGVVSRAHLYRLKKESMTAFLDVFHENSRL